MAHAEGVSPTRFITSSADSTINQHMSSSNSSGPPSEFGDLSLADTGTAMAQPRRSLPGSRPTATYKVRSTPVAVGASAGRPSISRQIATHNSDNDEDDSMEGSGEDGSDDESDADEASDDEFDLRRQRAHRQKQVFHLMAAFHPTQLTPDEFWPPRANTVEPGPASQYRKVTNLLAGYMIDDPDRIQVLNRTISQSFWRNQIVANQHIRFDRITIGMQHNIVSPSLGLPMTAAIEQFGHLYEAIHRLIQQSARLYITEKVPELVSILVDALYEMTDDRKPANLRPYVGNVVHSESRPARAFLSERGKPTQFIETLKFIRQHHRAAYRNQESRIVDILDNRLRPIIKESAEEPSFPQIELSRYVRVMRFFSHSLVDAL